MTQVDWKPIATAPKDRRILLWCPMVLSGECTVGEWNYDRLSRRHRPYWEREDGCNIGITWQRKHQPTHWAELPEGPVKP
jgi:hypothetical protein